MNPVSERYLLIDRLDAWGMGILLVYLFLASGLMLFSRHYKWERINNIQHFTDALMFIAVLGYLYWRNVLAWKGIYY